MNDNNGAIAFFTGLFFGAVILAAILLMCGATVGDQKQRDRQEAVEMGHAQWVASPKGEIVFSWNTNKCGLEKNR